MRDTSVRITGDKKQQFGHVTGNYYYYKVDHIFNCCHK